jgi:probable F420-dependent oxidoreductase
MSKWRLGGSVLAIGAIIPNDGPAPTQLSLGTMAIAAERAGAASLWVSDHLLLIHERTTDYPYSDDGVPTWEPDVDVYEALICCAAMAAVTEHCRIGTAVLVLPQRNTLEVAKMAATLDRLAGGRFALGVGAGWNSNEFAALGHSYETRGRRLDEMLPVLRDCWSGRPSAFEGTEVVVPPDVVLRPTPARPAGPPLLVGGMSAPAKRRAAELGDGWLAIAFAGRWDHAALLQAHQDVMAQRREAHPGSPFETVLKLHSDPEETDRVPGLVAEARAIGFDEVAVEPPWLSGTDQACRLIERTIAVDEGCSR